MAINSIRLPYIAEQISRKEGFIVMFPDRSGDLYAMDSVPIEVQRASSRQEYIKKHNLKPIAAFEIASDGILEVYSSAKNPKVLEKAQVLLESKFGINYLLAHGYVSKGQALAMVAGAVMAQNAGEMSAKDAVETANTIYETVKAKNQNEINAWLGVSSAQIKRISATKDLSVPSDVSPETIQTVDVNSEAVTIEAVTVEPRTTKSRKAPVVA